MIGFKALRAIIAELHGEGASPGALLARFKYFQRMGFPGGSNVGRGSRADYGLSDVLALALAFELLETSVSPVRVVRLLRADWAGIERAIVVCWSSLERGAGTPLFLAHAPGALGELGRAEDDTVPASDPLGVVERDGVVGWLDDRRRSQSTSAYLIDLSRFVQQVASAAVAVGGVDGDELSDAFLQLGTQAFGNAKCAEWRFEGGGAADFGKTSAQVA